MSEALNTALLVFFTGMITVFAILSLVVWSGQLLIRFINRFFPEKTASQADLPPDSKSKSDLDPAKLAAIVAAVDALTGGRGKISNIEKKN